MPVQLTDDEIRKIAIARVRRKRGFFRHCIIYIIVNAFLALIWAINANGGNFGSPWAIQQGRGFFWPALVMAGWGIGLLAHFFSVFVFRGRWVENEVEKEFQRIKQRSGQP